MPRARINDIEMYYEIHGQGFPLVLVAGYGCGTWLWFRQIPYFSRLFQTIIFDNRGVGKTDKPDGPYSIEIFAGDLLGLLRHLNIERCHVLGISMGGMIAQQVALSCPDLVEKLVLCSTTFGGPDSLPLPESTLQVLTGSAGLSREESLRRNMATAFSSEYMQNHPEVFEQVISCLLEDPQPLHASQQQFKALNLFNVEKRVHEISCPVLILAGDQDQVVPGENSRLLHERMAHSELVVYEGSGHLIIIERTEELNEKVAGFLAN